jgi:hypothetical protein
MKRKSDAESARNKAREDEEEAKRKAARDESQETEYESDKTPLEIDEEGEPKQEAPEDNRSFSEVLLDPFKTFRQNLNINQINAGLGAL